MTLKHVKLYEEFSKDKVAINKDAFLNMVEVRYPDFKNKVGFVLAKDGIEAAKKKLAELTHRTIDSLFDEIQKKEYANAQAKKYYKKKRGEKGIRSYEGMVPTPIYLEDYTDRIEEFREAAVKNLKRAEETEDANEIQKGEHGIYTMKVFFTAPIFKRLNDAMQKIKERYDVQQESIKAGHHETDLIDPYTGDKIVLDDAVNKTDKNGVVFADNNSYTASRTLMRPGARLETALKSGKLSGMSILMYCAGVAAGDKLHIKTLRTELQKLYPQGIDKEIQKEQEEDDAA